ncbi:hypothetical protein SAMN05216304_11385 [Bosea sp. OK403]|uniref:hypothetical protein n=1 Tax=Bosea sp. OK403 TaxID=1855286 RepID=UPI0008E52688|nr:hypothetical protein [Bosea sp. OK403]SFJ74834.1 hypothetical protein SAMN05216304_11385 [Bosea sp. OK403]
MHKLLLVSAAYLALAACTSTGAPSPSPSTASMNVAFKWCGASPEFTIGNVPAATRSLNFRMLDRMAPSYQHGGGTVPYTGKGSASVPCGALTGGYNGPSPPPPQVHEYEWTVTALDSSGVTLAVGKAMRKFPE